MIDEEVLALDYHALNLAIAEQVMGRQIPTQDEMRAARQGFHHDLAVFEVDVPDYSRDIKAAKAATDAIVRGKPSLRVHIYCGQSPDGLRYSVEIAGLVFPGAKEIYVRVEAATEEEARARAALMAHRKSHDRAVQ